MDVMKTKKYAYGIIIIFCLTGAIVFFFNIGISTLIGLAKGDDYIYYDPKQIPVLLELPVMVIADVAVICLLLPFRQKTDKIMQKLFIPVMVYCPTALVFGLLIAMIISFYPLGTHYYKCDSTSIISSGSHYARSKEICQQNVSSFTSEKR